MTESAPTPTQQINDLIDAKHVAWGEAAIERLREAFFQLASVGLENAPAMLTTPPYDAGKNSTQCIAAVQTNSMYWGLYVTRENRVFIATGDIR